MYYVYILRSEVADEIYTGFTMNLRKRLADHNSGKSIHTNKFRPWRVLAYTGFESEAKARAYERYLKTGSGIAFSRRHLI